MKTLRALLRGVGAALALIGCAGPSTTTSAAPVPPGGELPKVCGVVLVHSTGGMPSPEPGWKPIDRNGVLGGAAVELREFKGDAVPLGPTVASTKTDPEGHFCLSAPPSTYSVLVTASERPHVLPMTSKFGGQDVTAVAHSEIALDQGDVRGLILQVTESLPR